MKTTSIKYSRVFIALSLLLIVFSTATYAKTPSKKKVHKAYVKYINKNYMPYYKTGKRKTEKTPYGSLTYEYYDITAKEIDINKDGINELILGLYTGGARGSFTLFLYQNGKVKETKKGGTARPFVYKKKVYFPWSNGAADNGLTKVTIKKNSKGIKSTDYEEIYDIKNNITYKINNRVVSAKKYKDSLSLPSNYYSMSLDMTDIEKYIG